MKTFKLTRIAYLDFLAEDPEIYNRIPRSMGWVFASDGISGWTKEFMSARPCEQLDDMIGFKKYATVMGVGISTDQFVARPADRYIFFYEPSEELMLKIPPDLFEALGTKLDRVKDAILKHLDIFDHSPHIPHIMPWSGLDLLDIWDDNETV